MFLKEGENDFFRKDAFPLLHFGYSFFGLFGWGERKVLVIDWGMFRDPHSGITTYAPKGQWQDYKKGGGFLPIEVTDYKFGETV